MNKPTSISPADPRVQRLERITTLLDSAVAIPGTKFTVGIDPIIGLIPGLGDVASLGLSLYLLYEARELGIPKSTLLRMLGNIGVDTVVGAIPVVGDLADFGIKANTRNMRLIRRYLDRANGPG